MVQKWKKLVNKVVKSWTRLDLADKIEDIILWNNLSKYDIKPYEWFKNQYRVRIWDYRIIFEKSRPWNRIIKINKRWDIY